MIGKIVQDYQITELIGQGGMGDVFLATHTLIGKKAAIKVLKSDFLNDETVKARFINEAKALSQLNHTNIVTLYNFTFDSSTFYMIMEYAEGIPLDIYISKYSGPIAEKRCIQIFQKILDAFTYAHKSGIIHRDIKPSNIILSNDDVPKILDFGIAKMMKSDAKITKDGTRMGSIAYMSPEQILGYDVDLRTDIYSLGITLFEMLSGKLPYDVDTTNEFLLQEKIVREPLPSIKEIYQYITDPVADVLKIATEKNRENRFKSCYEFNLALYDAFRGISPNQKQDSYYPQNYSTKQHNVYQSDKSKVQHTPTEIVTPSSKEKAYVPGKTIPSYTPQSQSTSNPSYTPQSQSVANPSYTPQSPSMPTYQPDKKKNKTGVLIGILVVVVILVSGAIYGIIHLQSDDTITVNSNDSASLTSDKNRQDSIRLAENKEREKIEAESRIKDSLKQIAIQDSIRNAAKENEYDKTNYKQKEKTGRVITDPGPKVEPPKVDPGQKPNNNDGKTGPGNPKK